MRALGALVLTPLLVLQAVDARIPSRLSGRISHGLGGRLQGAGLRKVPPTKMEDLSWWVDVEEKVARRQKPPRRSMHHRAPTVAAAYNRLEDECLLMLSFATCLSGLSMWLNVGPQLAPIMYADGEPNALLI